MPSSEIQISHAEKQNLFGEGSKNLNAEQLTDQILSSLKTVISNFAQQVIAPGRSISAINIPASCIRFSLGEQGLENIKIFSAETRGISMNTTTTTLTDESGFNPTTKTNVSDNQQINLRTFPSARIIKKTYCRRKKEIRKEQEPIFGPSYLEESSRKKRNIKEIESSGRILRGHKRNRTPVSDNKLRRSTRVQLRNKGSKPAPADPPQASRSGRRASKKIRSHAQLAGDLIITDFNQDVEFPGLDTIEKMGTAYPEIPVTVIQNVAISRCGLAPSVVTADRLLQNKKDNEQGERSRDENTEVSNE